MGETSSSEQFEKKKTKNNYLLSQGNLYSKEKQK